MKKLIILIGIVVSLFAENILNLQISNSTLGVSAELDLQENFLARGFFLYNDNKDKKNFYSLGLKSEGNIIGGIENAKLYLLIDGVYTKNNYAIPIGVGGYLIVPNLSYLVFIRGEFEYAPKILSFDNANRFSREIFEIGIRPIENGEVFSGYRNISFNHNYNSVFYLGLGFTF